LHDLDRNFNMLDRPLIWVPGDNDWTDCWGRYGPSSAPFFYPEGTARARAPAVHLDAVDLGERKLRLERESVEGGRWARYSENVRWMYGPVVFVGLDVQGSNDPTCSPTSRVETFGATNNHWVSATVDPKDPNLFEFSPRVVAANVG
jgi:hypothetical protein